MHSRTEENIHYDVDRRIIVNREIATALKDAASDCDNAKTQPRHAAARSRNYPTAYVVRLSQK